MNTQEPYYQFKNQNITSTVESSVCSSPLPSPVLTTILNFKFIIPLL